MKYNKNIKIKFDIHGCDFEPQKSIARFRKSKVLKNAFAYDGVIKSDGINIDFTFRTTADRFGDFRHYRPSEIFFSIYYVKKGNTLEIQNYFFWFSTGKKDYSIDEENCDGLSYNILKLIAKEIFEYYLLDTINKGFDFPDSENEKTVKIYKIK